MIGALIGVYVITERQYLFTMSPAELSRDLYPTNPFLEAEPIAQYIAAHTEASDRIGVVGSEPEILFYAKRHSATGYLYTYPLMEPQPFAPRMQDEYIREVEAVHPKYLVASLVSTSWLVQTTSDMRILVWVDSYAKTCYDLVGVAEVSSRLEPNLRWDEAATAYIPRDADVVYTFRRKSDAPCTAAH